MRILAFVEYAAILAGIAGIVAGQFFGVPGGLNLGIFLVGAAIALGGVESVTTGRMGFRSADDQWEAYAGTPALIVGLMALLIGAAVIGCAYLLADGTWPSTLARLARRPGPLLLGGGLLAVGGGVLMMLNPRGRRGWGWTLLVRVPRAIAGFLIVFAGLTAVALGIWEVFEPRAYQDFVAAGAREVEQIVRMIR